MHARTASPYCISIFVALVHRPKSKAKAQAKLTFKALKWRPWQKHPEHPTYGYQILVNLFVCSGAMHPLSCRFGSTYRTRREMQGVEHTFASPSVWKHRDSSMQPYMHVADIDWNEQQQFLVEGELWEVCLCVHFLSLCHVHARFGCCRFTHWQAAELAAWAVLQLFVLSNIRIDSWTCTGTTFSSV